MVDLPEPLGPAKTRKRFFDVAAIISNREFLTLRFYSCARDIANFFFRTIC